jgi:lysyl-tRNA synthetase class 2
VETSPLENLRAVRIEKLDKLRSLGVNPFPAKTPVRDKISEVKNQSLIQAAVTGRLLGIRGHGKLVFADLRDESGQIQLSFKADVLKKEQFELVKLLDIGDFAWIAGELFTTTAGELTILVKDFKLLAKSIRPLPSLHFGLKDEEERLRQRYVELALDPSLRELFIKKARFWQTMRQFLIDRGFLEVETPVLETTAGGADATPFVTHHDHLDIDVYLRISMGELWQKRLMVGGFEKTFELGRQFRNEGMSREHLQDYTQMEFYWSYANYRDSMKLVEELYKEVAQKTFNTQKFDIGEFSVNLGKKWETIDYAETIQEKLGIDIFAASDADLRTKLAKLGISPTVHGSRRHLVDLLWKQVRHSISGPVFLIGHPVEVSPLAKREESDPRKVERYQVIIAGSEVGNGYSELNDPLDQAQRFAEQQRLREGGDLEAQMYDYDFVRALEYGMPPVTGFGVSERLFAFLANKPVRECVLFPLLKPGSVE